MNPLLIQAIKKASQTRAKLNVDMFQPINIFDACLDFGISVRFIDVSMEGMYVNQKDTVPVILLSSLRPVARRAFTCAHEFGHHVFGHGSKIDRLTTEGVSESVYDKEEYLVDAFAGALLMPVAGVELEFSKRKWDPKHASPLQFYTISSVFGTGFSTLISHCRANRLINEFKASSLIKHKPAQLLQQMIGTVAGAPHFKIIDQLIHLAVIELEVGDYIFLPEKVEVDFLNLRRIRKTDFGILFIAERPGMTQITSAGTSCSIRIQKARYAGLAEYRYLENNLEEL